VFQITERSLNMARSYWKGAENNNKDLNVRKKQEILGNVQERVRQSELNGN